jgi:hypothetical protein
MPDCLAFDQSSTLEGKKKIMMPGPLRYWSKPMKSGIFFGQYQTEIMNANVGVSLLDAETQL